MLAECEAAIKGHAKVLGEWFVLNKFVAKGNLEFAVSQSVTVVLAGVGRRGQSMKYCSITIKSCDRVLLRSSRLIAWIGWARSSV